MQHGWVPISRSLLDTDLWHDATTFRLYTYLLLKATHQEHSSGSGVILKKGQWIRSYRKIAQDLAYKEGRGLKEYSLQTIKKSIDKLVKLQKIEILQTEVGTLFTVLEVASNQGFSDMQERTMNGTVDEVQTNCERTANNNNKGNKAKKANNNKDNSPKQAYDVLHYELAEFLYNRILENNPNHRKVNLESWANEVRKMMEIDGRTEEQVRYVINWSQSDSFWSGNILSTKKLREKFDTLTAQIKARKNKVTPIRSRNSKFEPSEEGKKRLEAINNMSPEEVAELDRKLQEELEEMPY